MFFDLPQRQSVPSTSVVLCLCLELGHDEIPLSDVIQGVVLD